MYRRPESVLVLVYTVQLDVLLLRRVDNPDFWQSITGALEFDESAAMAAQRELLEETGIQATPVDQQTSNRFEIFGVWRARYHPDHTHNVEHIFSVQVDADQAVQLNPQEHSEYLWLPMHDALDKATSPTNQQAIIDVLSPLARNTRASD